MIFFSFPRHLKIYLVIYVMYTNSIFMFKWRFFFYTSLENIERNNAMMFSIDKGNNSSSSFLYHSLNLFKHSDDPNIVLYFHMKKNWQGPIYAKFFLAVIHVEKFNRTLYDDSNYGGDAPPEVWCKLTTTGPLSN